MIRTLLPACAFVLLSACATAPMPPSGTPAEPPPRVGGTCNAEAARYAVGKAATDDVVDTARVDSGSALVRVVRPGMAVTMDYRADRLNVDVNDRNAITGVRCG